LLLSLLLGIIAFGLFLSTHSRIKLFCLLLSSMSKLTGGGAPSTSPLYHGSERGVRWQDGYAVAEVRRRRCQWAEGLAVLRGVCEKGLAGEA
jgi:hypothetical protein